MHIRLIIRPRAHMSWMEDIRSRVSSLRDEGHEVVPRLTFEAGDAIRMARDAVGGGADLIIAAGGDGTVNEVVNGVGETDWSGRLGIIPLGTANDFAGGLGLPEDLHEAFGVAVEGDSRDVDIARVNDRHFINVSTGGVAATATDETPAGSKRILGPLAYVVTGVQKLPELEPVPARFEGADGEGYEGEIMLFAVGNGTRTGAGSLLTPEAELDDGLLDVVIVPGMTRVDFMALAPRLRSGAHLDHPDVLHFRTPRLEVEGEDHLSVNADGEALSGRRFEYGMTGRMLRVMIP